MNFSGHQNEKGPFPGANRSFFLRASLFLDGSGRPRTDTWAGILETRVHFERCETLEFQLKWGFGTSTAEGVPGPSHVSDLLIRTPRQWGKLHNRLTGRPPLGSIARRGSHLVHRMGPCPFLPFVASPAEAVLKSISCPLRPLLALRPRPPRGYLGEDA